MRIFYKTLLITMMLLSLNAKSFTPESGFWISPGVPGTGYSIEIQDNFMFVALYVYDEFGVPTWYTAGKTLDGNALFDTELNYTYNGPCIDCDYSEPITLIGEGGPITIEFLTETTGKIQFRGEQRFIKRFNFILGDEVTKMLGEWQAVIDFSSTGVDFPFNGDVLIFDNTFLEGGDKYVEGCRPDNTVDGFCSSFAYDYHEMAALFDSESNQLFIVVDDSDNYWLAYYLDVGLNQFDGVAELYPKNGGHNNIFYPVRGFRTASRSFIETGVGPSSSNLKTSKEANQGLSDKMTLPTNTKSLSEFSKSEQEKIMRRQTIVQSLVSRLNK